MMYRSTPVRSARKTPRRGTTPGKRTTIDDGPIQDFSILIEDTPVDKWQVRTDALQELVSSIPDHDGFDYDEHVGGGVSASDFWYSNPKLLRHLALPLTRLIRDKRSSVVKRVCESMLELFQKCRGNARYLFKDIMPTILDVHAQTVQVIRTHTEAMVTQVLPIVPCKSVMPTMLDRLGHDKSRTVREACALYLGIAIESWTEPGYLTQESLVQVGTHLIRALRDPNPSVRDQAKGGLEKMIKTHPELWNTLVHDPDGPAAKDARLQKWLLRNNGDGLDELSVASRGSLASSRAMNRSSPRTSSPKQYGWIGGGGNAALGSPQQKNIISNYGNARNRVPTAVVVAGGGGGSKPTSSLSRRPATQLGPPLRLAQPPNTTTQAAPFGSVVVESPPKPPRGSSSSAGSHQAAAPPPNNTNGTLMVSPASTVTQTKSEDPGSTRTTNDDAFSFPSPADNNGDGADDHGSSIVFDDEPFIGSFKELKKQVSGRRSRRSSILQERFRTSSSNLLGTSHSNLGSRASSMSLLVSEEVVSEPMDNGGGGEEQPDKTTTAPSPTAPTTTTTEHMMIAQQLLDAHRTHVDTVMETLRTEMDAMREFEKIMLDENAPQKPTADDVLDYYESVALCLDQRTASGNQLQREMDRISRGDENGA